MKKNNIAAIVISAGYSSRMGSFKPFLKFGEYTSIETVVNTFKDSGINEIIVVVGYRGCEIVEKLKNSGAYCVINEKYSEGMYSSILRAVEKLNSSVSAFFMLPVDVPLVKKHTIEILKTKYLESNKGIVYPTFYGEKGHPPLIDYKYKDIIMNSNQEGGLRKILQNFKEDSLCVPIFDQATVMDMDTKSDYEKMLEYFELKAPNRKECYSILELYNTPNKIINHCVEVARVALNILEILNKRGYNLNASALEAAALLHDIARREKDHAKVGEKILKDLGYEQVGNIISTHMDIQVDEDKGITENEILYLADKLVKEDKVELLEVKITEYLKKYSDNCHALEKITKRFAEAQKIITKIENVLGEKLKYG